MPPRGETCSLPESEDRSSANMRSALNAAMIISARWLPCVPNVARANRLAIIAPKIAPTVFAAYTAPTSFPGSWSFCEMDASASGKLMPHRNAPGSTTQRARMKSIWNVAMELGARAGFTGQSGSAVTCEYAAHASATTRSSCVRPRAWRGFFTLFASAAPALLPAPSPVRRSEEHTSELQSRLHLVCRLLLEKKKNTQHNDQSYTPVA